MRFSSSATHIYTFLSVQSVVRCTFLRLGIFKTSLSTHGMEKGGDKKYLGSILLFFFILSNLHFTSHGHQGWILLPIGSSIFEASLSTDGAEKGEEKESTDRRVWITPIQDITPILPENKNYHVEICGKC